MTSRFWVSRSNFAIFKLSPLTSTYGISYAAGTHRHWANPSESVAITSPVSSILKENISSPSVWKFKKPRTSFSRCTFSWARCYSNIAGWTFSTITQVDNCLTFWVNNAQLCRISLNFWPSFKNQLKSDFDYHHFNTLCGKLYIAGILASMSGNPANWCFWDSLNRVKREIRRNKGAKELRKVIGSECERCCPNGHVGCCHFESCNKEVSAPEMHLSFMW